MAEGAHPRYPRALGPATVGPLALPHRIVMGSMHLGLEALEDGGRALAAFYRERAAGGAGLIVTGGAAVSREGAGGRSYGFVGEGPGDEALARVVEGVHAEGGVVALQLFHAGRYAFPDAFGLEPVAPSAVASRFNRVTPRALAADEVEEVVAQFAAGAERARELGFDAVEVMGSEGYLVDQFLSASTNLRDDDWGGDAERRRRFGVEVARAVRAGAGPDLAVLFRLTVLDGMPEPVPAEEVHAFARELVVAGFDALDAGVGWHEAALPTVQGAVPPRAWAPWTRALREAIDGAVPVIAGNRTGTLADAEALLAEGGADLAAMARPFLADARLIARSRAGEPFDPCTACNQACIERSLTDARVSCMVNPRAGFELDFPLEAGRGDGRRVAVVGGGPAGMEAARALASLGCSVVLHEAGERLGGQFLLAARVPGKGSFGAVVAYYEAELERLGVEVVVGSRVEDARAVQAFDAVVVASGVVPRVPDLPGAADAIDYHAAFVDGVDGGSVAIVGGGPIAVDLAHTLAHAETGEDARSRFHRRFGLASGDAPVEPAPPAITVLKRSGKVGAGMGRTTRWVALDALRHAGVVQRTDVAYAEIDAGGVALVGGERVAADAVVLAAGQEPNDPLSADLAVAGVPHVVVGGARDAAGLDAVRAFREGLEAAYRLTSL